jgi:hypothetical protein
MDDEGFYLHAFFKDGGGMSEVYKSITEAIRRRKLKEPFTSYDFKEACPGWADGTYNAFLWKHRLGNPGGYAEYFQKISPGKFKLI